MLLTIITISRWNDEALDRTLNSVDSCLSPFVTQGIFEHVVVTSEKGTFDDSLYRKFIYLPPKGIYNAMNHGLFKATGEWVWFLNAGDECASDITSICSFLETSQADIISAGIYRDHEGHKSAQYGRLTSPHPGTLYKTKLLQSHGGYREDYKIIADRIVFDELRPISKIERVKYIAAIFYEDGISSSKEGMILRQKESLRYFKEKPWIIIRFYRLLRDIMSASNI